MDGFKSILYIMFSSFSINNFNINYHTESAGISVNQFDILIIKLSHCIVLKLFLGNLWFKYTLINVMDFRVLNINVWTVCMAFAYWHRRPQKHDNSQVPWYR